MLRPRMSDEAEDMFMPWPSHLHGMAQAQLDMLPLADVYSATADTDVRPLLGVEQRNGNQGQGKPEMLPANLLARRNVLEEPEHQRPRSHGAGAAHSAVAPAPEPAVAQAPDLCWRHRGRRTACADRGANAPAAKRSRHQQRPEEQIEHPTSPADDGLDWQELLAHANALNHVPLLHAPMSSHCQHGGMMPSCP
jgi:hypothetical protein